MFNRKVSVSKAATILIPTVMFKEMTLYKFNKLEINGRMEIVNQCGIFLDNFVTKKERINCYAVNKFFIEVLYNEETNTITEVKSFKTGKNLDKYSWSLDNKNFI